MALNTLKYNHLTALDLKGLKPCVNGSSSRRFTDGEIVLHFSKLSSHRHCHYLSSLRPAHVVNFAPIAYVCPVSMQTRRSVWFRYRFEKSLTAPFLFFLAKLLSGIFALSERTTRAVRYFRVLVVWKVSRANISKAVVPSLRKLPYEQRLNRHGMTNYSITVYVT